MKMLVSAVLMALLSFVACLYLPWWSIAIACFLVGILVYQKPALAFLSAFVAVFVLWALMALLISNNNQDVLAHRMSVVILKTDSPAGLVMVTGFIGALVAAFAALTGSYLRRLFNSRQAAPTTKTSVEPSEPA